MKTFGIIAILMSGIFFTSYGGGMVLDGDSGGMVSLVNGIVQIIIALIMMVRH